MRKTLTAFLAAILLCSCSCSRGTMCKSYRDHYPEAEETHLEEINYSGLVDVIFGYAVELRHKKQVWLKHSCALFDAKLEKIRLQFSSHDLFELQEGRRLLVEIVEGLIQRINGYTSLQPQGGRKFSFEDLELSIEFESFFSLFSDPNYMGRADLRDGIVYFQAAVVYNSSHDTWPCKQERYELTRQLVEIENRGGSPYSEDVQKAQQSALNSQRYIPPPKPENKWVNIGL